MVTWDGREGDEALMEDSNAANLAHRLSGGRCRLWHIDVEAPGPRPCSECPTAIRRGERCHHFLLADGSECWAHLQRCPPRSGAGAPKGQGATPAPFSLFAALSPWERVDAVVTAMFLVAAAALCVVVAVVVAAGF